MATEAVVPRVVFDCMVFLQGAARETSPAAECFRLADRGVIELCLSADILIEIRDVLSRPAIRNRFKSLSPEKVESFLTDAAKKAAFIDIVPKTVKFPRDPKDEPYLNLSVASTPRYLVSRDNDLLGLMSDNDFKSRYPNLRILRPEELLIEIAPKPIPPPTT